MSDLHVCLGCGRDTSAKSMICRECAKPYPGEVPPQPTFGEGPWDGDEEADDAEPAGDD